MVKNLILPITIYLSFAGVLFGRQQNEQPFRTGEILTFKVRWGFIRLGSIVLKQELKDQRDSSIYALTLSGESSPMLKFIDAAFVNRAIVSAKTLASLDYTSEVGRKKHIRISQRLDPTSKKMSVVEIRDGKQIVNTKIPSGQNLFNDLNFLMYVRSFAGSGMETKLASVYKDSVVNTTVRLPKQTQRVNVDAFKEPMQAYVFDAKADFTNKEIAGFGGEFRGYVSTDARRMLLKLEAKILIGSIVVELESFDSPSAARSN